MIDDDGRYIFVDGMMMIAKITTMTMIMRLW